MYSVNNLYIVSFGLMRFCASHIGYNSLTIKNLNMRMKSERPDIGQTTC